MHPRSTRILVGLAAIALVALVAVFLTRTPRPVSLPQQGPEGPVWLFDFGPALTPPFAGFARVSGQTRYEAERGYGWVDIEGELETGTFHDASLHWEGARNLNLVSRAGPDPLAASFATGPARFELELPPGRYDVWVLAGDWGLLEYIPHEAYRIVVEDDAIDLPGLGEEAFLERIETPGPDDTLTDAEAYERYVAPRFRWEKVTVDVDDGRLSVQVLAPERSRSILAKLGYYPHSDIKQGPPQRFAGALNAMLVGPSDARSAQRIEGLDDRRRDVFRNRHPRIAAPNAPAPAATDLERGYSLIPATPLDSITPDTLGKHRVPVVNLRATPGEYAPATFAIRPYRGTREVEIRASALHDGDGASIPESQIEIGSVRYRAGRSARGASSWEPKPSVIVPGTRLVLAPEVTKQIWVTLHVPHDAKPGTYRGSVRIQPDLGTPASISIELEVLPFRLTRPTHVATGLTYFVPIAYAYHDEERFWSRIRADFDDMRRHNMTTVQLTGVGIENFDGLDRLFRIYRDAGFEQPIYFLEAYSAIEIVSSVYGHAEETDAFYERYEAIFAELVEQARRRKWPPLIMNFGDEFTNSAREAFGAELARRLRRIPGIVMAADANGYLEVTLMAPHVDVLAFNGGWSGPNRVNGDRTLLNAETVALVREAGAVPWLVNVGKDRFSNGFYLWKMIGLGVRGKLEWIYTNYQVDPHDPFDGAPLASSPLAATGPRGAALASLPYERMRLGLDDLAYLNTLGVKAGVAPRGAERERAEQLLEEIDSTLVDDFETYAAGTRPLWPAGRYRELRDAIVESILPLSTGP